MRKYMMSSCPFLVMLIMTLRQLKWTSYENTWSPAAGTAWGGGCETFRMWGLAIGRLSWAGPWDSNSAPSWVPRGCDRTRYLVPMLSQPQTAPIPFLPYYDVQLSPKSRTKIFFPPINWFCQIFCHNNEKTNCHSLWLRQWLLGFSLIKLTVLVENQ